MYSKMAHSSYNGGDNISLPSCSTSNSSNQHSLSPVNSNLDLPLSDSKTKCTNHSQLTGQNFDDLEMKVFKCFDKRYYFTPPIDDWKLPYPNEMFIYSKWQVKDLQRMKARLNDTKNKLNQFTLDDWHTHTRSTNKAGCVQWKLRKDYNPEFLTQAWCKLYEILMTFVLVPSMSMAETNILNSVHLCEGPGAFVAALNHYMKVHHREVSWKWMATSLKPHHDGNQVSSMINDDRFILQTRPNWNFGVDSTGNLMNLENMSHLVEEANSMGYVGLVTADGSLSKGNRSDQEKNASSLLYCEVVTALHMLMKGGNFLLKMFSFFECDSVCLMYLLCCSFKSVVVNKPVTSKDGSAEVYLICTDYRGCSAMQPWLAVLKHHYGPERPLHSMFRRRSVPVTFVAQLKECADQFKSYQVDAIMNDINTFHRWDDASKAMTRELRQAVSLHYMDMCEMKRLNEEDTVVGQVLLNKVSTLNMDPQSEDGSHNDEVRGGMLQPVDFLQTLGYKIEEMNISWPYGDDLIKWLTFPVQLENFSMETGNYVEKVASSKFCQSVLLKIRNQVKEIASVRFRYNPAEYKNVSFDNGHNNTSCVDHYDDNNTTDSDFEEDQGGNERENGSVQLPLTEQLMILYPGATIVNFQEDLWFCMERGNNQEAENKAFQAIKQAIDEMCQESTLIFIGYPLLTMFSVGLVFMLSHLFEEVGFVKPHKQDFAIIFKTFRHWNIEMRKLLDDVERQIEFGKAINESVLALVPINVLRGNGNPDEDVQSKDGLRHFFTCITETNHVCVREQTLDIISTILH